MLSFTPNCLVRVKGAHMSNPMPVGNSANLEHLKYLKLPRDSKQRIFTKLSFRNYFSNNLKILSKT